MGIIIGFGLAVQRLRSKACAEARNPDEVIIHPDAFM